MKIADDFTPPKDSDQHDDAGRALPGPINDAVARLAYVAVTRTRRHLDMGGSSWIQEHPDGCPFPVSHNELRKLAGPDGGALPVSVGL